MRLFGLAALIWSLATAALAFEVEDRVTFPAAQELSVLKIISTADREAFEPIIAAFQQDHPTVTVDYTITGTTDLMQAIETEGAVFDIAISSAMDLQTKLANDGFARTYAGATLGNLPAWASWRNQLFAFTQEPAVLLVSDAFFPPGQAPRNREELITALRENPETFRGRIGTYDVRRSGFGYLIATQDSRNSDAFWRLMEVMGRLDVQLYCCSGDMIRDLSEGKLAAAYNVLGSYATTQLEPGSGVQIIELEDYVNVMLRTALIPVSAENPTDAQAFVDFLITLHTRPEIVEQAGLPSIDTEAFQTNSALRPIRFGPGLLVFLDKLRRENFLESWESSVVQE